MNPEGMTLLFHPLASLTVGSGFKTDKCIEIL